MRRLVIDQVTEVWRKDRAKSLQECRTLYYNDPVEFEIIDGSQQTIHTELDNEGNPQLVSAYNFGRAVSRIVVNVFKFFNLQNSTQNPIPGFELTIKGGKGPSSMIAPLAVIRFELNTFGDTGFLFQIDGRSFEQWEIYGRVVSNSRFPPVPVSDMNVQFSISALHHGNGRSLATLPAPFATVLANNV